MQFIIFVIMFLCSLLQNTCYAAYNPTTYPSTEYRKISTQIITQQPSLKYCNTDTLLIVVSTKNQTLNLYSPRGQLLKSYIVSTSKNGLGQKLGSLKTPIGLHKIVEKIGHNVPRYGIFKSRKFTQQIWHKNYKSRKDFIVTRILRLQGLETGVNRGKNNRQQVVDSFSRGIYIHGTTRENVIGTPVTIGCVHLNNRDIIELFNLVPINTLVYIY